MVLEETHRNELGFLRLEQVLQMVPIGRSTLYRMVDKGDFPSPCKFGSASLWPYDEIRRWADKVKKSRYDHDDII
ncbi:AlpA family phage regulatory protein [Brucella sp. 10RB9215]|uniref:helix-turn-helix transcriptional regulator n=1 Tax=Brucella sp. 10RB9215 TaxID=1149953 RepID=UPI0010FE3396